MKPVAKLVAIAVLGCGCSQRPDPMAVGNGPVVEVALRNFRFTMPDLEVSAGTIVRWRNETSTFHTVSPDGHAAWQEFQSSSQGSTFDVAFAEPGTYAYFCVPHQALGMTGRIVVR